MSRAWLVLLLLVGCESGPDAPWRPGPGQGLPEADGGTFLVPPPARPAPSCDEEIGPPMVRRLTSTQLTNALEDLLDSPDVPRMAALTDPVVRGYDVDARSAVVRDLGAQQLMTFAETVAAWAIEHRMTALTSCTDNNATCRVAFVRSVGRRLYREPVDGAVLMAYDSLFHPDAAFEEGARAVLTRMLQSPRFLYRSEIGERVEGEEGLVVLTAFELATELAFLATNSPPDEELLDVAAAGRLRTDEDLDRELDRLLTSPRGQEALARFARQWLRIDELADRPKDPAVPFADDLRASMVRETEALYLDVFATGGGVAQLFGASHTFVDGRLAAFYGLDGDGRRELAATDRAPGILGHGSVLATHARADGSSPTQRGALVRRRFLCERLPSPPPNVDTTLTVPVGAVTTRDRYAQHASDEICAGCHQRIDPVGFALEHYDGFARYRAEENGAPIDATGAIVGTPDGDVRLDGAASLAAYLAVSPEARSCFASQMAYYAYGIEGCTYADLTVGLEPDTPIRELMRRLVHTRHFRYRRAVD